MIFLLFVMSIKSEMPKRTIPDLHLFLLSLEMRVTRKCVIWLGVTYLFSFPFIQWMMMTVYWAVMKNSIRRSFTATFQRIECRPLLVTWECITSLPMIVFFFSWLQKVAFAATIHHRQCSVLPRKCRLSGKSLMLLSLCTLCSPSSLSSHNHSISTRIRCHCPMTPFNSMASLSLSTDSAVAAVHRPLEDEKSNDNDDHWLMIDVLPLSCSCALLVQVLVELRPTRPVLSVCSLLLFSWLLLTCCRVQSKEKERIIAQLMAPVTQIGRQLVVHLCATRPARAKWWTVHYRKRATLNCSQLSCWKS